MSCCSPPQRRSALQVLALHAARTRAGALSRHRTLWRRGTPAWMRGCHRGADSATAGRCEGADSAAADQRGGVVHLQAQRVHARLPPAAAEADLATAGCHSLLGNARRRRVFNDGSWGQGHGRMGSSWALGGPGAKLGHSGQSCRRGGRWRQYYFRAGREEIDNLLRIFFIEYLQRYILSIYKKLLKIKGIQLNTLELR